MTTYDWYAKTLGQKSREKRGMESLRIADASTEFERLYMSQRETKPSERLVISDNSGTLARFNDEKLCVEFWLTRSFPSNKHRKSTGIFGFLKGVLSGWVYDQLEAAADGIVDFKLDEGGEEPSNLIRIRAMHQVGFDGKWHALKIGENAEVTLEK